ncbi:MAG: 23S rRNA (uracil(1939)-C(5))-methyltransferase RlmD [Clostridia bacterium]|nr:23S rRNA (uracil(1939)-C(5))-methyltransferase RlmD [Clostridia bacterium]
MKKNDEIELYIDGYTSEGSGVGHYNGMAVFVSGAAAGDTVTVHIIKVKKTYAVGIIKNIITPCAARIEPDCPVCTRCGGCCYRHITYESELELKRRKVDDAFSRIAGLDIKAQEIIPSPQVNSYRNKAMLPVGKDAQGNTVLGFYSQKSHRIIPTDACLLHGEIFREISEIFTDFADRHSLSVYDEESGKGLLRHLYIRYAEKTVQVMVCPVINGNDLPHKNELAGEIAARYPTASILYNINKEKTNVVLGEKCVSIYGQPYIEDILCGVRVRISPLSFYQVNRSQAENLYKKAAEYAALTKDDVLLDLYCGAGTIGLSMADKVKTVIGAEIVPQAIENAKANAGLNGITNARFICADAAQAAKQLREEGIKPDVIIVDPPRKGCDNELIETVTGMAPSKIVYVSCDPATLARDAAIFDRLGYKATRLCAADMFPRTSHVETVVLMSRTME